jgi:glycosyltransferase involved in cell wall biosynthesis
MSDGRLPILYLAPWVDYGGSDKGTIDWFRWLDRSRFAPSLITTQPSANSRLAEVVPFAEEVWSLPDLMLGAHFAEFILDFVVSREVGVVHVMNSRLGFDLLPDFHALEHRPKVVVQLHVEEPTRDGYVRYATTRYGTLVDAFSVSSQHLADIVSEYGIPRDRIAVIHTGVDGDGEFCPERVTPAPGLSSDLVHILFPGRVTAQKDPLLMVEVGRELDRRGLEFRIHVVGTGDLEASVRERVAAYGLERRVYFEPPTRELAGWYRAADLLLMTSVFEGVPYVIYEALAMGVPVVAPALAGNAELMDGVGGSLVEHRERAIDYADALEPLMRDRALRERVGAAGRSRVLGGFSLRQMADRHAELYTRLRVERLPADRGLRVDRPRPISFTSRPARGTPLVSIVTPCFNHGRWLRECVRAVREQTYPQLEMIVCDDGSTEQETLVYLEELAAEESNVRVVRMHRNSGPSAARNRAVKHAAGRYVLAVDADNVLLPDAVERLVAQLQGAGEHVGYVYQNLQFFGNREDYFEPPSFNTWLLTRGNYVDACALFDREIFDQGFRYPDDMRFGHEDWDFVLSLAERGVQGEPMRAKTLRYRKHGFSRSDQVGWAHPDFRPHLAPIHRALYASEQQLRWDNPSVRLKARWAPSLTVIALRRVAHDSPAWESVLRGVHRQIFRDFQLYAAVDREPAETSDGPPLRMLPPRLARRPAEALAHALELCGASRNLVVTAGSGIELLDDPGCLERIVRLVEYGASPQVFCFGDGGAACYPFVPLPGDDRAVAVHSLAWSRRHESLRETPSSFDDGDPVGGLGRWHQLRRTGVQWRHLTARSGPTGSCTGTRFEPVRVPPLPHAEAAEQAACLWAPPAIPGPNKVVPRWQTLLTWTPAAAAPLVRHRRLGRDEWIVDSSLNAPEGFFTEYFLGVVHLHALEGTKRLVEDADAGFAVVARGGEPDVEEMARTLGYVGEAALPLLAPLLLCRHAGTGTPVLVSGDDDPLLGTVELPPLAVLGWIDRMPVNPRDVPGGVESSAWLRGLVRTVDRDARRHRVALGATPVAGSDAWELGALLDRDPGGGIPAWVDADGRLHTSDYSPTRRPFDVRQSLRWAAEPLAWRRFGRPVPRARAVARRSIDAVGFALARPGLAAAPPPDWEPQAWLLADDGPDRAPIFSAVHPVSADQLVTRDPSEASELGYASLHLIGFVLRVAEVTGTLARPRTAVPWGSRFGESLTRGEEPW